MNTTPEPRPAVYQVSVSSTQQENNSGLRTWLVTVKVMIDGELCQTDQALLDQEVVTTRPELEVTFLGQADMFRAVYAVQEISCVDLWEEIPISVRVTPLYHPTSSLLYKLDHRLAKLVGREYLAHPKYALTIVHAHARAHNLYADKSIICDETLQQIFGCPRIQLQNLWQKVSQLMKRQEQSSMSVVHLLSDLSKPSKLETAITVDQEGNIFPANWSFPSSQPRQALRVQSLHTQIQRKKSFKRNLSVDV